MYDPSSPDGYGSFYGYGAGALGPELGKISIDDDNEATRMFPNDCGDGDGLQYWRNAGATNYAGSNSSGWFIDKVEAFRPYSYNRLFYLKAGTQYYPNLPAADQLDPASGFVQQTSDYQADDLTRGLNTWGAPYGNTGASFPGQNGYNPSIVSIENIGQTGVYGPDPSASTNNVGWNHQGSDNDFAYILNEYFKIGFEPKYVISTPVPQPKLFKERNYFPFQEIHTDGVVRGIYNNIKKED